MLGEKKGKQLQTYVADYVVFDLETTGISCKKDKIVEISAVKVEGGKVIDEFTTLVNPLCPIPSEASKVNGITDSMVEDAPAFDAVLPSFLRFAGENVLVGHNIHSFDLKFIYRDCEEYLGRVPDNDYIDTLPFARRRLPGLPKYRLTDLASHYGIEIDGAHRALFDCHMNQKIFEALAKEPEQAIIDEKLCPRCGSPLKKRSGKFGAFYGCTGYPGCRYTENIRG